MTVTKVSPQICEALRIGKYWNGKTKWSHLHELLLLKARQEEETAPVQWWPLRKHHVTVRRKRNPFQQEWTNNGTSLCEDGDPLISCEDERERKSQEKHAEAFTSVWMRAATLCWGNVGLYKPKLMICALLRWNRNSEAGLKCYCELRRFKFPFSGTKISYLLNINIRDMLSFSSLLQSELNECICRVLSDTNVCHVSYKQQLDIVSTWLIHRSAGASAEVWQPDILSLFVMISPSSPLSRDVCMSPLRAAIMSGL